MTEIETTPLSRTESTPTGLRMPAEWEPHEGCLMAWPARKELWSGFIDLAENEYAAVANAIADHEKLWMIVPPGGTAGARRKLTEAVELIELPIDDSWLRDSGPIFAIDEAGRRVGVDFRFNSWGERFLPFDNDAAVSAHILSELEIDRVGSGLVLEGGSITVDGQGTLITTEQCLLNPNRNAGRSRAEIEAELGEKLGAERIIWLPYGHAEDAHTDGHVDGVCIFVRPGVVITQSCDDPAHPDYARMRANRAVLDSYGLEVHEVPLYPYRDLGGHRVCVSYINFYVANGAVIVPTAGSPIDRAGLEILAEAFPDREIVGVPGNCVAFGGGGVHCITQQVPAA